MSGLESLYQELILDHAKNRRGFGLAGSDTDATSHQRNPICGDEITVRVHMEGDRVASLTWEGAGCSISQASASMLAELSTDLDRAGAEHLIEGFREAMRSKGTLELDEDEFGDATALSGVSKYTARVKCAMLSWVAFEDALRRS
ncbi:Fe-S cluster assembly sulfur transfer protein SufU [Microbacterium hatanonis]|jgi:nitrogen fixation NifU-like protein|uniref:SUF system NifU family Fe-S cluster assembly protein n=1 Tax=Microbacterium hatanonis TaxID=404366 RepID=A0A5C8HWL3_9MICO|nr:SUF system NifU family Fe-S cluster assembly protein [Microbacterium hatanonis]TXK09505.1 SUF system NifU family Fe-S cluster assembly protein [Microbacterium hatanonis]